MAQEGGKQQNTAYGVFVQACWAQHKRQYPDELIHKEIEEFNKQCSVWWYNLSEQERERFQEMADRSNATNALNATSYTTQVQHVQQVSKPFKNMLYKHIPNLIYFVTHLIECLNQHRFQFIRVRHKWSKTQ